MLAVVALVEVTEHSLWFYVDVSDEFDFSVADSYSVFSHVEVLKTGLSMAFS